MADAKISSLTELTAAPSNGDWFVLVDVSDTSMSATGTDKKLNASYILDSVGSTVGASGQVQQFTTGVRIGTSTAPSVSPGLDIVTSNTYNIVLANVTTNATNKIAVMGSRHYTNTEEPVALIRGFNTSSANLVTVGGGSSSYNAATQIDFITAATTSTLTGTSRMTILSSGYVGVNQTTPTALLHVGASTTTQASLRIDTGTAPTTPNTGDMWMTTTALLYRDNSASRTVVNTNQSQALSNKTFVSIAATNASGLTLTDDAAVLGVFIQDATGNVGIRTNAPGGALHVYDTATSGTQIQFQNADTGGKTYIMLSTGSASTGGAGKWQLVENVSGNRMTFDGVNDRLGIGPSSTSPLATLDVRGEIRGNYDTNTTSYLGRAAVGYDGATNDWASFSHIDHNSGSNFALSQSNLGETWLNTVTGSQISFSIAGTRRMIMNATQFYPNADNVTNLGKSGNRWVDVWAVNGTIQTSDANDKVLIKPSALGLEFVRALQPVSWVWKKDGKRPHYGFIAQQVKEALDACQVDDFAGYIHDQETDTHSLRYNEFIAPIVAALQELASRLEKVEALA